MNMKKKTIFMAALMSLMLTFGVAGAYAHGGRGGGDLEGKFFWKARMIQGHQQELGLSDAKADEIKALMLETKKNLIRQNAEIEVLDIEISEKLHAYPVDVQAVNDLIDQKFEAKKTKTKSLVDSFAKLKASLTQDQYTKLKELFKEGGTCKHCGKK